jgi:hypothetical protein
MDWKDLLSTASIWLETHPGIASWARGIGSLAALTAVFLVVFQQNREANSREETDRIRRAQGLALLLDPVLTSFELKIESAISEKTKLAPPEEIMLVLDQLCILGIAGDTSCKWSRRCKPTRDTTCWTSTKARTHIQLTLRFPASPRLLHAIIASSRYAE